MNNSTDWSGRFVSAVCNNLKTWSQLLTFRQPMPAGHQSRDFVFPVFISMLIHAFLAFQLWVLVTGPSELEPGQPLTDTPLILSLSTFTADSPDEIDPEEIQKDPPEQRSQSFPGTGRKPEAETVVISKDSGATSSEDPEDKSPSIDATPSFDLDTAYRMNWDFGIMTEFEAVTSTDQWVPGSGSAGENSLDPCSNLSSSLEIFYCMDPDHGRMSKSEIRNSIIRSRKRHAMEYIAEHSDPRDNCKTAYTSKGLLAIPYLIRDAVTDNGCKWEPILKMDIPQGFIIHSPKADPFKSLLPFSVKDNKIMFNLTKEGEIWVKGKKVNLNAIKGLMEIYRKEYPEGSIVITCDSDSVYETALEMRDQIRAAKINMVVIINLEK